MPYYGRSYGSGEWRYIHLIPGSINFPGDGNSTGKHRDARKARFLSRHNIKARK